MPFKNLSEVEFDFIWVGGGRMPEDQANNLIEFVLMTHHEPTCVIVWVDNKITYAAITAQLQEHLKRKNTEIDEYNAIKKTSIKHLRFKEQLKNLKFKIITPSELEIPPILEEFIEKTRIAKLWSGLGDIYKLLIQSRKHTIGEPHVRIYVEADNRMLRELWNFFKDKAIAVTGYQHLKKGLPLFTPATFKVDLLLLDITSKQGTEFAANIRTNLVKILALTPALKANFEILLENAIKNDGLAEEDVLGSYGMLITTLFRMQFLQPTPDNLYGFKDYIIFIEHIAKLFGPISPMRQEGRSWLNPLKQLAPIDSGKLHKMIIEQMREICDPLNIEEQHLLTTLGITKQDYEKSLSSIENPETKPIRHTHNMS